MTTTPFQYLVQYLEKLQGYAIAEYGYRRVMMDKFVGEAQKYVTQLEGELAGIKLMEAEGDEFAEGIVAENERLRESIRSLVGAGELNEDGWLVFERWNDRRMYPPDDPYTIAYKALGGER